MIQQHTRLPVGTIVRDQRGEAYIVEALLGTGGFSAVYKVRDWRTRQRVFALKETINPDQEGKRNIAFEAQLLMRLQHPALPRVYSVFESHQHKRIYLVMDYIEGKTLEQLCKEQPEKFLSLPVVLMMMAPVVDALKYLHAQQPPIVHRDIKPSNIIVSEQSHEALLVDFGLAKEYIAEKTTSIFRYGTPGYAAPEQYGQGTNTRTDVYGLAATIYALLTGTLPSDAMDRGFGEQDADPLRRADQVNPVLPASVGKVLQKAMSLKRDARYASIGMFWEMLLAATQNPAMVVPEVASPVPPDTSKLNRNDHQQATRKPQRVAPIMKTLLVVLTGIIGLGLLIDGFLFLLYHNAHTNSPVVNQQSATSAVKQGSSTITATTTARPSDSLYPSLSQNYRGNMNDAGVSQGKSDLALLNIKQQQGNFSGTFEGLHLNGSFTGVIDLHASASRNITITAVATGNGAIIKLVGSLEVGGSLRGSFHVYDSQNNDLGEYGVWYAQIASA